MVLLHYDDLIDDPRDQMGRLADRLEIEVSDQRLTTLAEATTFEAMKGRASWLAPDRLGVLKDPKSFFRAGRSGDGRSSIDDATATHYQGRLAELASPELIGWLHGWREQQDVPHA